DVYRHGRYITAEDGILPSPDESGWLYIKNLNGVSLTKVRVVIKVDLAEFVAWYKPFMSWDENGDPWSADHGVAPVEVCAPDNLDACNESNCQTDGEGYWYNDVGGDEYCHETPACDGDTYYDCLTESQCLSADGDLYWYEDEVDGEKSCHPVPACKRDIDTGEFVEDCTPVNCITAVQCEDADFFWYEDEVDGEKTCHELRACERNFETGAEEVCSAANCITPDQCTSSNFYWYEDEIGADKYCHEMKSCERNLNTGGEEDCSPDNCITEDQCDDAHFYWYKGEDEDTASCHQEPEQGVCSENNLLACSTEAECVAAGGEWYNYSACVKKRSSSYTPYTPPASSSSPPSTGSGSTAVSGSNWFSFLFATNSAPAPAPVCDAQHLDDCDQTGCAGLGDGYWWYDGACRAEPVQTDFRGHLSSAPVSPGAGADDGVIAAGEGLSFTIDVPADCRLYALLSIPDVGAFFISNEEILTANMVPVAGGTIPVIADICPLLTGEWEFLKGTWTVYTVAVPAAVGESPAQLGAYLEQGGLYALGSYTIEVGCQEVQPQVQPQEQSGYTLYDIPRPSQD
ncbi:MAG: hypothetical protein U9N63_06335, partial [Pseudomonadota bacterium]|nr:hypothetical protein [Pseudomonadota bacterium]